MICLNQKVYDRGSTQICELRKSLGMDVDCPYCDREEECPLFRWKE